MPGCYSYNCDAALGDHTLNDCDTEVTGGFRNIIILECNHQLTDASDGSAVNTEISAGRATLIKNVKCGIGAASSTTVTSNIANTPDKITKYTTDITLVDGNVNNANMTFYNTLFSGQSFGGIILHNADEQIVLFYDDDLRCSGSIIAPDNNGEYMRFEGTVSLDRNADTVNPEYSAEPSGVFD